MPKSQEESDNVDTALSEPPPPSSGAPLKAKQKTPILQRNVALSMAVLSGLLYFLAFPGVDLWFLAPFALVPLIVALRGQTPKMGMFLGWLAGFTMTMTGFYWLLEMLQTFSGFNIALCFVFMAILCAYQGGRIALAGWLACRGERNGHHPGLVFAAAFATSELVFPLLFPWTYAATVHQIPVLLQTAELGGPILVVTLLVCVNLAIAELVVARVVQRTLNRRYLAVLLAVPVVAVLYGLIRMRTVDQLVAAAPKGEVGIVQANMSLLAKRRNRTEGLRRHLELTEALKKEGKLDLVVWSETSVMAPQNEDRAALTYRLQFAGRLKVPLLFGAVLVRRVNDARGYVLFNSALTTDENGSLTGRYDKQYLLAFGEYLPFGETFPSLYKISRNSGRFTPGKTLKPLTIGEHEIATFICYEDIIPSFVNSIVNSGNPDLLVNITNDAWFGDTTEPWIHLALAKLRAIEHRRFLVRSTNSGISAFVDPLGRVISHTDAFKLQAQRQQIAWLRSSTVFEKIGQFPWWIVALLSLGMALVKRKRRSDESDE